MRGGLHRLKIKMNCESENEVREKSEKLHSYLACLIKIKKNIQRQKGHEKCIGSRRIEAALC